VRVFIVNDYCYVVSSLMLNCILSTVWLHCIKSYLILISVGQRFSSDC